MERKILIVGAGNIGKAELSSILSERGISESDILIVEDAEDFNRLPEFRNNEVRQRLEVDEMLTPKLQSNSFDYMDEQKKNSQQGWRNRSKHHR